jgi:drug/metabolite transporter (DMT)-like permease
MLIFVSLMVAFVWGGADFCGGLASRKSSVLGVLAVGYAIGAVGIVALGIASGDPWPTLADSSLAALGGLVGLGGVGFLYAGLARGPMHIVGPTSAGTSAALPVLWDLANGRPPSTLGTVGVFITLIAIVVLGLSEHGDETTDTRSSLRGVAYGLAAGLGFGGFFIAMGEMPDDQYLTAAMIARVATVPVLIAVALWKRPTMPTRSQLPLVALGGALDVTAGALYSYASSLGATGLSAVISSLYPAGTIALAGIVLHEKIKQRQWLGLIVAAVGVSLVALSN